MVGCCCSSKRGWEKPRKCILRGVSAGFSALKFIALHCTLLSRLAWRSVECSEPRLISSRSRCPAVFLASRMQFYPSAPPPLTGSGGQSVRHPDYSSLHYHQTATSPRMNWPNPAMHPNPWAGYDFSQYGYPAGDPNRSPPYHGHVTSPDAASGTAGTPHNISDILGAQQQASLRSEIAKTPSSYQQSPTSTAASVFSPEHGHPLRSPTTPNTPYSADATGAPSFYLPAMPRPGMHGEWIFFLAKLTSSRLAPSADCV